MFYILNVKIISMPKHQKLYKPFFFRKKGIRRIFLFLKKIIIMAISKK